jgi:hypothetical protein
MHGHNSIIKVADTQAARTNILSLLLSLLFLVHPINIESVAYIAASEPLYLFGLLALLISVRNKISTKNLIIISALLLLSLLTKEIALPFLFIILLFQFLFYRKRVLKLFLYELASIGIYLLLRFAIVTELPAKTSLANAIPIDRLSFLERLANIPAIVFYYLYTALFPLQLAVEQRWIVTKLTAQEFYLPLLLDSTFYIALCVGGIYIYRHKRIYFNSYLFFFVWFLTGLLMIVQIFPLDMTVADRWFYFPLVGILGMVGVGIQIPCHSECCVVRPLTSERVAWKGPFREQCEG